MVSSSTSHCSNPNSGSTDLHSGEDREVLLIVVNRQKKRAGRKKFKETRHPVYHGVRWRNNKWVCEVREPNKKTRIWLGTYPVPEMAARAHDVAALALRGQSACLNFADSFWSLPVPATNDPKQIRKAAALAAEAFRPGDADSGSAIAMDMVEYSDEASSSGCRRNEAVIKKELTVDVPCNFDVEDMRANAAERPLLSPSPCFGQGFSWDDSSSDFEVSLWNY